jgi:hypothetical protein
MMICAVPLFSVAQVIIEFTSYEVSNVNNQKYSYNYPLGTVLRSSPDDVYTEITATIHNVSDTTVTLVFSNDDVRLGKTYYSKQIDDWVSFDRFLYDDFKDTVRITAHGSYTLFLTHRYSKYHFITVSSLYYLSDIAANMRLYLSIPGQGAIMSGMAQKVVVNDMVLHPESFVCNHCGDTYTLVNNELMNEYIQEQPWLFPFGITDELIRQEFACNMLYARKLYSMMSLPEITRR